MSRSNMDYKGNIFMGDFETLTPNTKRFKQTQDTEVILWYVENINDEDNNAKGINIKQFMDGCFDNDSKTIFFHNLSFDGDFIVKFLKNHYGFEFINSGDGKSERHKSKTFTMFNNDKQIYYIQAFMRKRVNGKVKDISIYFRCSLMLLVCSVDALGNKINGDNYDYEPFKSIDEVPKDFLQYCIQDVKSLTMYLREFDNLFANRYKYKDKGQTTRGLDRLTIGSVAFQFQRQAIEQHVKYKECKLSFDDVMYFRNGFLGALSSFAPYIQDVPLIVNGFYYDVNSMYPGCMLRLLPYGKPLEKAPAGDYLEYGEIHVISIAIKDDLCPRVFKSGDHSFNTEAECFYRYIAQGSNFDCYYMKDEFELLQQLYGIEFTVTKKGYFKAKTFLKDYAEKYYALRLEEKAKKSPLELLYKIFLNASYGKWGQHPQLEGLYYSRDNLEKGDRVEIGEKEYIVETVRLDSSMIGDLKCYIVKPDFHKEYYPSVMIAATITSYARQKIIQTIIDNQKNVLYFDTDSIMLSDVARNMELDNTKLGGGKLECSFSKIIVKGSKVYSLFTDDEEVLKYAFSGINKKFLKRNLNYNGFLNSTSYEEGSKLMKKKTKSGIILIATSYKQKKRST